jgi:hypothetical protein
MIPPLDIFRLESDGQLIWRASADGDDAAQRRVKSLMASEPADYVIYSQETGHKTFVRCKTDAQPCASIRLTPCAPQWANASPEGDHSDI